MHTLKIKIAIKIEGQNAIGQTNNIYVFTDNTHETKIVDINIQEEKLILKNKIK